MAVEVDDVVLGFVDESTELVERISDDVLDLESHSDPEVINRIFRAFHTIKGNSRMLGFTRLGDFTHGAEDLMSLVRNGEVAVDAKISRALTKAVDIFIDVLQMIRDSGHDDYDYAPTAALIAEASGGAKGAKAVEQAAAAQSAAQKESASTPAPAPEADVPQACAFKQLPTDAEARKGGELKMLVVEDDFASRLMLNKFLSRFGQCHIAVSGEEAVKGTELACDTNEPYDLICMDIMMSGMDGIEAVRRVRAVERRCGLREAVIIMVTAISDPQTIIRCCYESGANYYIIKPLVFTQLEALMRRYGLLPEV